MVTGFFLQMPRFLALRRYEMQFFSAATSKPMPRRHVGSTGGRLRAPHLPVFFVGHWPS
jgi:hypothetical protein